MKRFVSIILMGLALLGGISCKKQAVPQEEAPAFKVVSSTLVIPAKGGQASIAYEATKAFTVSVDKTWCTAEDEGDQIVFTAAANEDLQSRYTVATVSCGGKEYKYTIQQFGFNSSGFEPSDIRTSALAAEFNFPYAYDEMLEAATDASWITLTVTKNNLHVAVAENTTVGSPEDPSRVAEIAWHLGVDTGVIKVTQSNVSFMKQDDNWSVYYDGVKPHNGVNSAYIYNDVADPAKSGPYSITYVSKSEFEQSGMEMDDYAMVVGDNLRVEIEELVEFMKQYVPEVTFGDLLYEDSDFKTFDPMETGDYIAFAIGFTAEGAISGHYQYSEFTVKGGGGGDEKTGYDAWLGEWTIQNNGKSQKWTITAKQQGSTYTIKGFAGKTYDIEAVYDSATSNLLVYAQNELGTAKSDQYGEGVVGLYGMYNSGYFASPNDWSTPYLIFTAKLNGSSASLTPAEVKVEDGTHTIEQAYLIAEGDQYFGVGGQVLPSSMTKTGGDNPGGDEKTGYNAWLGEWESVRGASTDTWKITALEEGSTYTITGIEGKDFPVTAIYDSSTKGIEVHSQVEIGTYTSSTYGECSVGFYGGWGESNFATGKYVIFTGSMNGNEVSLTQGEVKFSDGSSHVLERAQFVAATSDGKYLTLTKDKTPLPTTLTRKGQGGGDQGGDGSNDDVLGKWICPSVTDYWGENTFSNWTFDIRKSGSGLIIKGFDIELEATASKHDLEVEDTPATYNASSKTITVALNTETGLGVGDYPITWVGADEDFYFSDIEFQVDINNHTITLSTAYFGAYINDDDPGFYSLYSAPIVFYKEGHVPSSYKPAAYSSSKKKEFKTLASKKSFPMFTNFYGRVEMKAHSVVDTRDEIRLIATPVRTAQRSSFKYDRIK